jgi:predicted nucleic acid-binding protein
VSHLLDTSVITRVSHAKPAVLMALETLRGELGGTNLARCTITDLEYGFSAENERQWDVRSTDLSVYKLVDVESPDVHTALEIQRALAKAGLAKRKVPDLIIAAVAINNDLTLIHYDADYEFIASVSALKHAWIVPRGSTD